MEGERVESVLPVECDDRGNVGGVLPRYEGQATSVVCPADSLCGGCGIWNKKGKKKIRQEPADEQKCGVRVECSQWAPQSWGLG